MKSYAALPHDLRPAKPICTFCGATEGRLTDMNRTQFQCDSCIDLALEKRSSSKFYRVRAANPDELFRPSWERL